MKKGKRRGLCSEKEAVELGLGCPPRGMTRLELGVTWGRVQSWALPLTCCGYLGWLLNLSEPPVAYL